MAAVRVVERVAEKRVAAPALPRAPRHDDEWLAQLDELTGELDRVQIYPRDRHDLARALDQVTAAFRRPAR